MPIFVENFIEKRCPICRKNIRIWLLTNEIYNLMLNKGAHATVAIEGNTLKLEDVEQIAHGGTEVELSKKLLYISEEEVQAVVSAAGGAEFSRFL